MKIEQLNIEIGKPYPASEILQKIDANLSLDIMIGHAIVEYKTEKKHKYFINRDYIKELNDLPMKVYTIIPTSICKDFSYKILEQKDVKEILKEVKENHKICCVITDSDLENYNIKSKRKAITSINKIFKLHMMAFKASNHIKGIKITYRKLKEESSKKIE